MSPDDTSKQPMQRPAQQENGDILEQRVEHDDDTDDDTGYSDDDDPSNFEIIREFSAPVQNPFE